MKRKKDNAPKRVLKVETVSQAIQRLTDLQEEHGDIPIRVGLPGMYRKPVIRGIRYVKTDRMTENGARITESIDILPHYDVMGSANELDGCNSIVKNIEQAKTFFLHCCEALNNCKTLLETMKKQEFRVPHGERMVEFVPQVREDFIRVYDVARGIQVQMKELTDFAANLKSVVHEPFGDEDYVAFFAHHIDPDMSDAGFATLVGNGSKSKSLLQRLGYYIDIIKKLNQEISRRRHRISQLEKRIQADKNTQEGENAKVLRNKNCHVIAVLENRKTYIKSRFLTLAKDIHEKVGGLTQIMAKNVDSEENI